MLDTLMALLKTVLGRKMPTADAPCVPEPVQPEKAAPPGRMQISRRGIEHIKRFEGLRLKAYLCPASVWTIGYGHTGSYAARQGNVITEEQAEQLLRDDLKRFEDGVNKIGGKMTQGQYDALVSFAFNLGVAALAKSTLLKRHKAGLHEQAGNEFLRWVHAGNQKLAGLVKRRSVERVMYLT